MLTKVKPDHHAVEAARKEVFSSVVAKYLKFIAKEAPRLSRPENEEVLADFIVSSCLTKSQLRAFQGTERYGDDIGAIRRTVANEIATVLERIGVLD